MLTGKYWLEKDGTLTDTSSTEHAFLAREKILGLDKDDPLRVASPFYKLTKEDALRLGDRKITGDERGDYRLRDRYEVAAYRMAEGKDPRWIFIEQYDAIRIAKAGFWCWKFTEEVRERIRLCGEYWFAQKALVTGDMMEIVALGEKSSYEFNVRCFRDEKISLLDLQKFKVNPVNDLTPE